MSFKYYTPEQEEKIEKLRKEAELERINKQKHPYVPYVPYFKKIEIGYPVFVIKNGVSISGYIKEIRRNHREYIVSTPMGKIKVLFSEIRSRYVEDLSHVEIPEELKKWPTKKLLEELQTIRSNYFDYNPLYYYTPKYSREQIKAELKNRPHITNKRERKLFKNESTNNNKRITRSR